MTVVNISEAHNLRNNINLEARCSSKGDVREVNTKYGPTAVCTFTLEDDTGDIALNLWGEAIVKLAIGDRVRITNAFTTTYKGTTQLNIPKKNGRFEVV